MGDEVRFPWIDLKSDLWRFMSLPIWLFYLIFHIVTVIQLCQLLYHKHRFPSYHSTVLIVGSIYAGLRLVYFGKGVFVPVNDEWVNFFEELVCWLPFNLQYFLITILFLFNSKITSGRHWTRVRHRYYGAWGVANGILLICTVAWLGVVGVSIYGPESIVWTRYMMVIIPDFGLIGCVVFFGVIGRKQSLQKSNERNWWHRSMILNSVIALCLAYRAILFILMTLFLLTPIFETTFSKTTFDILKMTTFVISELVPIIAILFYLKQIPGTRGGILTRQTPASLPGGTDYLPAQSHFADDGRTSTGSYGSPLPRGSPFKYGTIHEDTESFSKSASHSWTSRSKSMEKGDSELEEEEDERYEGAQPITPSARTVSSTSTLVKSPMQLSNMS